VPGVEAQETPFGFSPSFFRQLERGLGHRRNVFRRKIPESKPLAGTLVGETVAAGYTYQGQLLRPALVNLDKPGSVTAVNEVQQMREAVRDMTQNSQEPNSLL